MRKTQITSPLLLLGIIILSTTIILTQNNIESTISRTATEQLEIIRNIAKITEMDLEYQLNLTNQALQLISTVNSSGTIIDILSKGNQIIIEFSNEIWINYVKEYKINNISKIVNNTLMVPYPYLEFVDLEQKFEEQELKDCMGTDCSNFINCVNDLDSNNIDYEPEQCIINPLRVKISIIDLTHALTITNPYQMWNNSLKNI